MMARVAPMFWGAADAGGVEGLAVVAQHRRTRLEAAVGQQDVGGDHDGARPCILFNPVVRSIETIRDDHAPDPLAHRHAEGAVADHADVHIVRGCLVPLGDAVDLLLNRAGIGIDEDGDGRDGWGFHANAIAGCAASRKNTFLHTPCCGLCCAMTQPAFFSPAPPANHRLPRSNAEYRWTPPKIRAFFDALARCGKVAAAARAVGMSRQSAYRLLARYPGLDEPWRIARETGRARRKVTDLPVQGDSSGRQGDTSARAR